MRAILALTLVGAVTALTSVAAMAQTPKQTPSQAPATPPDKIDSVRTPNEHSLTEFWTPERLRNAQPMPMPRVDPNDVKDQNKDQTEDKK